LEELDFELADNRRQLAHLKNSLDDLTKKKEHLTEQVKRLKYALEQKSQNLRKTMNLRLKAKHYNWIEYMISSSSYMNLVARKRIFQKAFSQNTMVLADAQNIYVSYQQKVKQLHLTETSMQENITKRDAIMDDIEGFKNEKTAALKKLKSEKLYLNATAGVLQNKIESLNQTFLELLREPQKKAPFTRNVLEYKGLMNLPTAGRIIQKFGREMASPLSPKVLISHTGWDISAVYGQKVKSIFDGEIVFAKRFQGYGNLVIIDHGQEIYSLYAHLSEILVQENQRILESDAVGRVGDTGSLQGAFLYFEIRKSGNPVDPAPWIK
jgi:septal ring factor EnvC (AmiA/AmiB activator)